MLVIWIGDCVNGVRWNVSEVKQVCKEVDQLNFIIYHWTYYGTRWRWDHIPVPLYPLRTLGYTIELYGYTILKKL